MWLIVFLSVMGHDFYEMNHYNEIVCVRGHSETRLGIRICTEGIDSSDLGLDGVGIRESGRRNWKDAGGEDDAMTMATMTIPAVALIGTGVFRYQA